MTAPAENLACVQTGRVSGDNESLRRANRAFTAENARLRSELADTGPVVEAAKVWRQHYGNTSEAFGDACTKLAAAVDALPTAVNA
ncbi:hypothetical protein AB0K35_28340 [Micromonospora sp. NPDC053740]|uniref:hypothetical protein n=1 Tax=Micromonospora sp. NPDC053740 TaxID=3155173 RepID=UPI0034268266